jgi:uncharacterized protein (DUF2062 family)
LVSERRRRQPRARGWIERLRRLVRYRLIIPVFRSPHPPEFTARGVANGVFWGLTPSVGLQTIEIVTTWFVARRVFKRDSSLIQAGIWVWVNNPITMIPLYYAFYVTGLWLMGNAGLASDYDAFVALWNATAGASWTARVTALAGSIGLPLLVGSIPYATIGGGFSYRWALRVVRTRRRRISETFRTSAE